jgi:hypothetical protein
MLCLFLLSLLPEQVFSSVESLKHRVQTQQGGWNQDQSAGGIVYWTQDCDWSSDYDYASTSDTGATCGSTCQSDPWCSHFTVWFDSLCYLKHIPADLNPPPLSGGGSICGSVARQCSDGSLARYCTSTTPTTTAPIAAPATPAPATPPPAQTLPLTTATRIDCNTFNLADVQYLCEYKIGNVAGCPGLFNVYAKAMNTDKIFQSCNCGGFSDTMVSTLKTWKAYSKDVMKMGSPSLFCWFRPIPGTTVYSLEMAHWYFSGVNCPGCASLMELFSNITTH